MTITEVYEKYKHLDTLLRDPQFGGHTFELHMLRECWLAIVAAAQREQP